MASNATLPDSGPDDQTASGSSIFWALITICFAAMQQPSFSAYTIPCDPWEGPLWPHRSSPLICLVDGVAEGWLSVQKYRDPNSKWLAKSPHASLTVITTRFVVFVVAVLPQAIKLFSMRGIPGTQALAAIFFAASIISMIRSACLEEPEADLARLAQMLRKRQDHSPELAITLAVIFLHMFGTMWIWSEMTKNWTINLSDDGRFVWEWILKISTWAFMLHGVQCVGFTLAGKQPFAPYRELLFLVSTGFCGFRDLFGSLDYRSSLHFGGLMLMDAYLVSFSIAYGFEQLARILRSKSFWGDEPSVLDLPAKGEAVGSEEAIESPEGMEASESEGAENDSDGDAAVSENERASDPGTWRQIDPDSLPEWVKARIVEDLRRRGGLKTPIKFAKLSTSQPMTVRQPLQDQPRDGRQREATSWTTNTAPAINRAGGPSHSSGLNVPRNPSYIYHEALSDTRYARKPRARRHWPNAAERSSVTRLVDTFWYPIFQVTSRAVRGLWNMGHALREIITEEKPLAGSNVDEDNRRTLAGKFVRGWSTAKNIGYKDLIRFTYWQLYNIIKSFVLVNHRALDLVFEDMRNQPAARKVMTIGILQLITAVVYYLCQFDAAGTYSPDWTSVLG